jgi:two-component system response regulator AtoC
MLAEYFIKKYSVEIKTTIKHISEEALAILMHYQWKGNVRELENTMERAMILCNGDTIMPEHITLRQLSLPENAIRSLPMDGTLEAVSKEALRIVESQRISKALRETKGNKSRAAEILQVSYKTLLTKIKDYNIET